MGISSSSSYSENDVSNITTQCPGCPAGIVSKATTTTNLTGTSKQNITSTNITTTHTACPVCPTMAPAKTEPFCRRREGYSPTEINNIYFLENEAFDDLGHLFTKKPMLVMVKASWCGYCTKAAPAFQEFADKYGDKVLVGVIREGEDQTPSGKRLMARLKSIMPTFKGFPHVVLYVDGKPVADQLTDRSLAGLVKFVSKYVRKENYETSDNPSINHAPRLAVANEFTKFNTYINPYTIGAQM